MDTFILLVGFWILCGIAGGVILSQYDEAGTGCLLGGLLGPIGLIIAWTMRDTRKLSHVVRVEPVSRFSVECRPSVCDLGYSAVQILVATATAPVY